MRLTARWWEILRYAWSVRLMALAFLLTCLEVAFPLLEGFLPIPQRTFAILAGLSTGGAFIARLMAQKTVTGED